ncbi:hypothetical protein [Campylobacter concisus]|uniref:hypothetical protein n=1 Tax=Campylobacter concisus TaxID=199 RepID=UPI000CD9358A|nr:hypothetical protein [Campylobacter concisus]
MTLEEKLEVIKAYAEGKPIEYFSKFHNNWFDKIHNIWDLEEGRYRIKPKETAPKFKVGDVLVFIGDVNTAGITTYEITEVKQGYYLFNNTSRRPIEEVEKEYISERDVLWFFEIYDFISKEVHLYPTRITMSDINKELASYNDVLMWKPVYSFGFKLKENSWN